MTKNIKEIKKEPVIKRKIKINTVEISTVKGELIHSEISSHKINELTLLRKWLQDTKRTDLYISKNETIEEIREIKIDDFLKYSTIVEPKNETVKTKNNNNKKVGN